MLSIADTDTDLEQHDTGEIDEAFSFVQEDVVLPSVELEELTDDGILQKGLIEDSPRIETASTIQSIKVEPSILYSHEQAFSEI